MKKRILVSLLFALIALACFGGAVWIHYEREAKAWIDAQDEKTAPDAQALARAEYFWQHRWFADSALMEAERLRKLSWLRLLRMAEGDPPAPPEQMIAALREEWAVLTAFLAEHEASLSDEVRHRFIRQITLYMNRATLLDKEFAPVLRDFLARREDEMEGALDAMSIPDRQEWQREIMMSALLSGREDLYWVKRNEFVLALEESRWPRAFAEGVRDFYDGALLCAMNRMGDKLHGLDAAARQFTAHPKLAPRFLHHHLNTLILQKARSGGTLCREALARIEAASNGQTDARGAQGHIAREPGGQ